MRATHNRSPKQSKRDPAITVQTDTTVVFPAPGSDTRPDTHERLITHERGHCRCPPVDTHP